MKKAFAILALLFVCHTVAGATRTVRVGYFKMPGFQTQTAAGERSGYGYEFLQLIAKRAQWNYTYVGYEKSWWELINMLQRGEIDLMACVTKTPEREKHFDFSSRMMGISTTHVTVKAGNTRIVPGDFKHWKGARAGQIYNSNQSLQFASYAKEKGFTYQPVYYRTYDEMSAALRTGVVDLLVTPNIRRIENEWVVDKIKPEPYYLIVKKGNKELLGELDTALSRLFTDAPQTISWLMDKYYTSRRNVAVRLTVAEQQFVQDAMRSNRTFRILFSPDRFPMSTFRHGKAEGILPDIARSIAGNAGLSLHFVQCDTREEYADVLKRGDFDIVGDMPFDYGEAERRNLYVAELPFFSQYARIRLKSRAGDVATRLAVPDNILLNRHVSMLSEDHPMVMRYRSVADTISAVKNGDVDEGILFARTANDEALKDHSGSLVSQLIYGHEFHYAFGVQRSAPPELLSILEKGCLSLSSTELAGIIDRYELTPLESRITFREWLWNNRFTTLTTVAGFLSVLLALLMGLLFSRRKIYRDAQVIRQLPLRFFVCDRNGRILLVWASDLGGGANISYRKIDDLSDSSVTKVMKSAVDEAFASGHASREYVAEGQRRGANVIRLADSIFGQPSVFWFSQNIEDLQQSRERAAVLAEQLREALTCWDEASKIANMTSYRMNILTRDFCCDLSRISRFWPVRNGRAIQPEEYVSPEDVQRTARCYAEFLNKKTDSFTFSYKASWEGETRWIRQYGCRDKANPDILIGILQNVTEHELHLRLTELTERILSGLFVETDFSRALDWIGQQAAPVWDCTRILFVRNDGNNVLHTHHEYTMGTMESVSFEQLDVLWNTCRDLLQEGNVVTFTRLADDPMTAPLVEGRPNFADCALVVVPVMVANGISGAVAALYPEARHFSEADFKMFRAVASCISLAKIHAYQRDALVKANEELARAAERAQAAEKSKSFFLATMSHEIRTPLNAVIGFSELLKDSTLSGPVREEYLTDISVAGNALLALINDILDLSKLEAGQFVFTPVETDFAKMAQEMQVIFRSRLQEKDLSFKLNLEPMPKLAIDKLRLRQILFNLIGNAVKFTNRGGITVSAAFTLVSPTSGTLRFAVADTGRGIPPEDHDRIFEPFVQSSALRGTQVANNGTGLGLPIVRRMLRCIHGDISVKSEMGVGSVFTVELCEVPVCTESEATPIHRDPFAVSQTRSVVHSVLIVDDVPMNLKVLRAICRKCEIPHVQMAADGVTALQILERESIDLVLTDLWMPKMSGQELAQKIRADPRFKDLPVYAVTADTEARTNLVFTGIVLKPVTIEQVRAIAYTSSDPLK